MAWHRDPPKALVLHEGDYVPVEHAGVVHFSEVRKTTAPVTACGVDLDPATDKLQPLTVTCALCLAAAPPEEAPMPDTKHDPPPTLDLRFCPECGGDDRLRAMVHRGDHGLGNPPYMCPGEIQELTYHAPPPGAAILAGLLAEAERYVKEYADSRDASLMGHSGDAEVVAERLNAYATGGYPGFTDEALLPPAFDLKKLEAARAKLNFVDEGKEECYLEITGGQLSAYQEDLVGGAKTIGFTDETGSELTAEAIESEAYEMLALVEAARAKWGQA